MIINHDTFIVNWISATISMMIFIFRIRNSIIVIIIIQTVWSTVIISITYNKTWQAIFYAIYLDIATEELKYKQTQFGTRNKTKKMESYLPLYLDIHHH